MKTILFASLLRNNENYVHYMLKIFNMISTDLSKKNKINLLIYTNNNKDNTEHILKNNESDNIEIISENLKDVDLNENLNSLDNKVKRLYHLREKFLKEILKRKFDYLFMFDSDIYFNTSIISKMIDVLEKSDFEAITTNTICQNNSLYYDFFSLVDKNNKNIELSDKAAIIDFHFKCFKNKIIEVKSAFGGLFLTKSNTLKSKKLSYFDKTSKNTKFCEHIPFNKNFKLGFVTDINPIRLKIDKIYKHERAYNIIKNNKTDNRNIKRDLGILTIEVFLAIFSIFMIIKKRYVYIFLLTFSICLIVNNFEEFF